MTSNEIKKLLEKTILTLKASRHLEGAVCLGVVLAEINKIELDEFNQKRKGKKPLSVNVTMRKRKGK